MELKDSTSSQYASSQYTTARGIHTMELKGFCSKLHSAIASSNPYNGIESVFTMIALRDMPPESIQWNWKISMFNDSVNIEDSMNPYNGIERFELVNVSTMPVGRIHTMELKDNSCRGVPEVVR